MVPFYGWGSTASRLEPFRRSSLLFMTKFPWYMIECQYLLHLSFWKQTSINVLVESIPQPITLGGATYELLPWNVFFFQKRRSFDSTPPIPLPKKIHGRNQKGLEKQDLNMRVNMSNWLTIRNNYILLWTSLCLLHKQSFRAALWNRCFFNVW